jgi:Domain of unknown function (DUF1707)
MSDVTTQPADVAVRASDAEREQTVTLLQRGFADGRLTRAELEERAGAAYAAQTRAQLRDITADLPAAQATQPGPQCWLDPRLLCILLCVHPPAGLVYWLLTRRRASRSEISAAGTPDKPLVIPPVPGEAVNARRS